MKRSEKISGQDDNAWAVSFGDVITLLLVFFIIIASAAEVSSAKFERLKKALKNEKNEINSVEKLQKDLKEILEKHKLEEYVEIEGKEDGVHVTIKNELLFKSGSSDISEGKQEKLIPILNSFHELPDSYRFSIEGHTDDIPINSKAYPSNWHLSAQRALSILEIFRKNNFKDSRLRVQGFADQKPMEPNKNKKGEAIEENQKKNRRAVIRIF